MNFTNKPTPLNVFDKDAEESYEVVELMFTDVVELTGVTPVDSVRRIHREHIAALRGDYDDAYADQDFA